MSRGMDFSNKTILVTGASRGIGAEIARTFAELNGNLILCDLSSEKERANELAKDIEKEYSVKVNTFDVDIKDISSIELMVEEIKKLNLQVDILVNNAGVNSYLSPFEISEKQWDNVLDVNLKGTFFMTKLIAEVFLVEREGNIISIASQHGVVANFDRVHYCASKAGIIQMTKAFALEWSKFNVRVNCVSPTFVETKNNHKLLYETSFKRKALNKIPLKKYAKAEDIADSVVFLASSMARMITGHNLIVDGGWTIY
ncbi:MAG: SDR family oxidoreductase [Clostridium sp.]|uniref:SDR family NAD(P)-dependent oxidoreductase n=1 Tax=Clostridium sp. DSM 8431 TaxID=1761781 RepID=UPI0008E96B90|nr:SDR family oxidoreductase [Clostridium sp. DSM 8431]MCR4943508.1 SDR family oxidoreductase [Clostridium sp.]SFU64305.1 2-deoxy-D-gluconate 3-dehydrogenase [Clostridium sp. DSM 8431]